MFDAMERGELTTLYVLGENPADSEADRHRALKRLERFGIPGGAGSFLYKHGGACRCGSAGRRRLVESEGTVTYSERRVQRVRHTVPPPDGVRDDMDIIFDLARRLGHDWGAPDAERIWNEVRTLSPMHAGMSYRRLEEMGGIQWPCYDESHPGEMFLHSRLWSDPLIGPRAPFQRRRIRAARRRSLTSNIRFA